MNTPQNSLSYIASGVESGRGNAILLLDWTPWETTLLADALASQYRVISVEPPGAGYPVASVPELADAVGDIASAAKLDSYTLIGVSLGADVAFRLASLYFDAVDALILVSPAGVGAYSAVGAALPPRWDTPELAAQAMLAHPENASHRLPPAGRTAALAGLWQEWYGADRDDVEGLLSRLECPTLAVFGQEDRLTPREAAGLWRELVPNCNICFVYDAGYAIGVDRPDALVSLVSDFVQRRETFIVENRSGLINP